MLSKSRFIELTRNCNKHTKLEEIADSWQKGQPLKKDDLISDGCNECIHYGELFTKYSEIIYTVYSKTNRPIVKSSKSGDILFPSSDVTPNGLATCSSIMKDNVMLGGDIIILRPKPQYSSPYLSFAIKSKKDEILKQVTGAIIRHSSVKGLKKITIPIIEREEQESFIKFVQQIDKSKLVLQKALENLVGKV